MRFTAVIVMFFMFFLINGISVNQIYFLKRMETQKLKLERQALCTRFVAESFRMTCRKKGFVSFEEWQKKCGALFKLEYIGFSKGADFMNACDNESGVLFYGMWIIDGRQKEVFCRKSEKVF